MSSGWLSGDAGALPAARRSGGAAMVVVDERWSGSPVRPASPTSFDRQPPQDLAAEQSVLGGMLMSKDAVADVVESLRSGDFDKPAHTLVTDAILDVYSRAMRREVEPVQQKPTPRRWPPAGRPDGHRCSAG